MDILKRDNGLFDIEVNGIIVGGGSMIEADDDFNYLERLDVDTEHRGNGHGTAAMRELLKIYGSYYLAPDNANAQRLYERIADKISQKNYDAFGFAIDQGFGVYEI